MRNRFYGRIREARLSQAAIDVLALVAYQQPITGEKLGRLRGKPSSHMLAHLVRRGLLRIERPDPKRRISHYRTTDRFLKLVQSASRWTTCRGAKTPAHHSSRTRPPRAVRAGAVTDRQPRGSVCKLPPSRVLCSRFAERSRRHY